MKKYLKIIFLIILTIFITTNVNAEVNTYDRNTLDNYGVNKSEIEINDSNKDNVLNSYKVDSSEKIYDFSDVLTDEEESKLREQINTYEELTNMELIILIDSVPYSYDSKNEEFACDFYDYNDFGLEQGTPYSGTLLFRNTYESDPYYDFYMFGDAQLYYQGNNRNNIILDGIYNDLHNKNYYDGFTKYISYLTNYYNNGEATDLEDYEVDSNGYLFDAKSKEEQTTMIIGIAIIISLIASIITIAILIAKNKMIHKERKADNYTNNITYTKKIDHLISSVTTHYTETHDSGGSSGGGGFHSSGGSSGMGHSSGGGRHG